jgi:hypothetical protein
MKLVPKLFLINFAFLLKISRDLNKPLGKILQFKWSCSTWESKWSSLQAKLQRNCKKLLWLIL